MTREEFIKNSLALGIGLPFLTNLLASCGDDGIDVPQLQTDFSGKVIIIGAGAAGLAAGYLLQRYNVDFEIIEASSDYGGRVKRATDFADFPIDIGAEWIHTSPSVLADIIDDPSVNASIDFVTFNPQTFEVWDGEKLKTRNLASNFYSEYKFKNTTWYGFFEQYIVPSFEDKIVLNKPIVDIDYSGDKVVLTAMDNDTFEADKVLVTAPIKILQQDTISFTPSLPAAKIAAINSISMGDGLKVFIEFRERFYPDMLLFGALLDALSEDDKIFYDAAFRKDASRNVMGLFTINSNAAAYTNLGSDQEIIDKILSELDEIFDGKASQNYIQHIVQNWSAAPYIQGSYSNDFSNDQEDTVNTIKDPVDNKIFFAGEALSIDNQATVHGACESGYAAVGMILS